MGVAGYILESIKFICKKLYDVVRPTGHPAGSVHLLMYTYTKDDWNVNGRSNEC